MLNFFLGCIFIIGILVAFSIGGQEFDGCGRGCVYILVWSLVFALIVWASTHISVVWK